jgi:hypothetical protein
MNWRNLYLKKILPPFRPNTSHSNFDPEYTELPIDPSDYLPDEPYTETNEAFNQFFGVCEYGSHNAETPPGKSGAVVLNQEIRSLMGNMAVSKPPSADVSVIPPEVPVEFSEQPLFGKLLDTEWPAPDLFNPDPIPKNAIPARYVQPRQKEPDTPPEDQQPLTHRGTASNGNLHFTYEQTEVANLSPIPRKRDNYVQERNSKVMQSK